MQLKTETKRRQFSMFSLDRRVHITSVTLDHLNGAYKVEDGDGQERDPYLKEHGVITYLVINPKVLQQTTEHFQTEKGHWIKLAFKMTSLEQDGNVHDLFKLLYKGSFGSSVNSTLFMSIQVERRSPQHHYRARHTLDGAKMRASVRMTRYLESWGAAKPFANLHHRDSMTNENGKINTAVCHFFSVHML